MFWLVLWDDNEYFDYAKFSHFICIQNRNVLRVIASECVARAQQSIELKFLFEFVDCHENPSGFSRNDEWANLTSEIYQLAMTRKKVLPWIF